MENCFLIFFLLFELKMNCQLVTVVYWTNFCFSEITIMIFSSLLATDLPKNSFEILRKKIWIKLTVDVVFIRRKQQQLDYRRNFPSMIFLNEPRQIFWLLFRSSSIMLYLMIWCSHPILDLNRARRFVNVNFRPSFFAATAAVFQRST